jgi:crotonobetainyl-CoA:carnitine CoA-transferase CaiB-like acyl-CoA transferase
MCGLMLAFIVAAGIWQRRRAGQVARVDFSMIEAMLWTMAEPLLSAQLSAPPGPRGNEAAECAPHGVWRCAGDDHWIAIAVTDDTAWRALCSVVPALSGMAGLALGERIGARSSIDAALEVWLRQRDADAVAVVLLAAGIAAAPAATSLDLVASSHLRERGFWDVCDGGVLPGLPWRAGFSRASGPAPGLGEDTDRVLATVLGLSQTEISRLRRSGALG